MAKVLLIDADSTIPNIALMKISSWHKNQSDKVSIIRLNLPYYPGQKKRIFIVPSGFDKVYCSVIFEGNKGFVIGNNILFGGTGVDLKTTLSEDIEKCSPDYTLYPNNDISYGFLTRGCIRKCYFCKVPEKEGYIQKVANIDDIVFHKKVKFLDNNILAYPEHKKILKDLVDSGIKCQFNQGLDIRLIDSENSELLSNLNYLGNYTFSFDDWAYRNIIEEKIQLLSWRKPWQIKFFVYVHPSMPISDTVNRIEWLKGKQILVYLMRDISCWGSTNSDIYTDIAAYCNQVHIFKKLNFESFLIRRHRIIKRIEKSLNSYNGGCLTEIQKQTHKSYWGYDDIPNRKKLF